MAFNPEICHHDCDCLPFTKMELGLTEAEWELGETYMDYAASVLENPAGMGSVVSKFGCSPTEDFNWGDLF